MSSRLKESELVMQSEYELRRSYRKMGTAFDLLQSIPSLGHKDLMYLCKAVHSVRSLLVKRKNSIDHVPYDFGQIKLRLCAGCNDCGGCD